MFGVGGALWCSPVLSPQTAFSDCVLWTDTRHRNSSGRQQNPEATAPLMQCSSTNFTYVQEMLQKYQPDYWGLTGCLFPCSTPLTWRRSKMSLKTASCWEQSSSMETSSRCVPFSQIEAIRCILQTSSGRIAFTFWCYESSNISCFANSCCTWKAINTWRWTSVYLRCWRKTPWE